MTMSTTSRRPGALSIAMIVASITASVAISLAMDIVLLSEASRCRPRSLSPPSLFNIIGVLLSGSAASSSGGDPATRSDGC